MTYTVEAGRQILRDGVHVATVYSSAQTGEKEGLFPADADDFTREVAHILNTWSPLLEALEELVRYLDNDERYYKHQVVHEARAAIRAARQPIR